MMIGAVPMFAVLIYQRVAVGGSADAMFTGSFFTWFTVAGLLGVIWVLVLVIQIARKTDPVYDRLAGTAVVREASPNAIRRCGLIDYHAQGNRLRSTARLVT